MPLKGAERPTNSLGSQRQSIQPSGIWVRCPLIEDGEESNVYLLFA